MYNLTYMLHMKTVCAYRNTTIQVEEETTVLPRHHEIPEQVFTRNIRDM